MDGIKLTEMEWNEPDALYGWFSLYDTTNEPSFLPTQDPIQLLS